MSEEFQGYSLARILTAENVRGNFEKMLGKKAQGFITSVLQVVQGSDGLQKADPMSVYFAAATAATMDLPINPNLGFAWIIPYEGKAQFQMGYKGYVQLGLRTAQYKRMNVIDVWESQFKGYNTLTEALDADFSIEPGGKIVGQAAYFQLINGFEKTNFWTTQKVFNHGKKFSKSFDKPAGVWRKDFDSMARKTVLKETISKWGILSIEMQTALRVDQAVILDENAQELQYVDNPDNAADNAKAKADAAAKATEDAINKATNKAQGGK